MDKFFGSNINNKRESLMKDLVVEEFENEKVQSEDNMTKEQEILVDHEQENMEEFEKCVPLHYNISDPGNWKNVDQNLIDLLVKRGPLREDSFTFSKDSKNRHFSSTYYIQHLANGEKSDRKWLVYSISLDKVFCFCCKLFKQEGNNIQLANEGINDWKNLSFRLKSHETSHNMRRWIELERRLQQNNNLAFQGTNEKIYEKDNGNFLGLIEMIAEFDPILREHIRRIQEKEIHYHYLSHKIQNEFIFMLAGEIKTEIIKNVDDTSGQGLFVELLDILKKLELNIGDLRGQGYDNGSNMKGKHKGLQKKVLEINPRAFYTPCGCHSLNLALCDMESQVESVKAIRFQALEINAALKHLVETCDAHKTYRDAQSLLFDIMDFEFLFGMVTWYNT
ncbi:uncharacterized protein LOC111406884 [Olea europaea var. sylvestris]|uniref:uncharacterized protein LOC111406884 n=1 Tax=Olea europaea var. sylvestris TaxID=158386 RepID=UPI000C1D3FFD|nr:uncharacterized protein LOC111406884 [Olea europaea var. sylvestris]